MKDRFISIAWPCGWRPALASSRTSRAAGYVATIGGCTMPTAGFPQKGEVPEADGARNAVGSAGVGTTLSTNCAQPLEMSEAQWWPREGGRSARHLVQVNQGMGGRRWSVFA